MLLDNTAIEDFRLNRRVTIATGGHRQPIICLKTWRSLALNFPPLQLDRKLWFNLIALVKWTGGKAQHWRESWIANPQRRKALSSKSYSSSWWKWARRALEWSTNGEIVLSGNTFFARYYHNPEATVAAFRCVCFHTDDIAVVHPSGDLEIRDRSKDIITSGGENFSSLEVELCFTITPMSVLHQ